MRDKPFFSIVVPVYNNAATLETLTAKISDAVTTLSPDFEIIYVDDGSGDSSKGTLKTLSDGSGKITVIELAKNGGQWEATLLGIAKAKGQLIATIDADLQYDPADILKLYQHLRKNNLSLVYGIPSRMIYGMGGLRNRIQNLVLQKQPTSSFKVFHRDVVFDDQNRFFCKRHFECHEKFHVSRSKKGWIEVNDREKKGGFRRHVFRNINIMLTYLPEYDLHLRHPLALAGGTILGLSSIVLGTLAFLTDLSLKHTLPLGVLMAVGVLLCVIGLRWKLKYKRVATMRAKLLATLGA